MRVLLLALLLAACSAAAQDYEREKRWATEVETLLLVHGLGVHPDKRVIGILRVALSEMGYATLSIQMPVEAPDHFYTGREKELAAAIGGVLAALNSGA